MKTQQFVDFFRASSPYIHSLRGKTVVVLLTDQALAGNVDMLVADLALLASLGIKLVVVYGGAQQIDRELNQQVCRINGIRVTGSAELDAAVKIAGQQRFALEAAFSRSLINSPMFNSEMRVVSGNFVNARPIGVLGGTDYRYAGRVRQIHAASIAEQLQHNSIVLLSHIGVSATGEMFNIQSGEVAVAAAQQLSADKLLIVGDDQQCRPEQGRELSPWQAKQRLSELSDDAPGWQTLKTLCDASDAAIPRVQVVNWQTDGGVLAELYTRDGAGTMVSQDNYDQLRPATVDDIGGILALLQPLEEQGVLVRRSRERLETEIGEFNVFERDGLVIGCAALHPFETQKTAELACLVIHPDYRGEHRAGRLLTAVENQAKSQNCASIFVLTTQTAHWFIEHGFELAQIDALPSERTQMLDQTRNSKVLIKQL